MAEDMYPKPQIADTVHYRRFDGGKCTAAIVVQVHKSGLEIATGLIDIMAFFPEGGLITYAKVEKDDIASGTWHWVKDCNDG